MNDAKRKPWLTILLLTLIGSLVGCAGAYHAYPCGQVPYRYCRPAPLAYTPYAGCPTPLAARTPPVARADTRTARAPR